MEETKLTIAALLVIVSGVATVGTLLDMNQGSASGLVPLSAQTPSEQTGGWCYVLTKCHLYGVQAGYQIATYGTLLSSCLTYDDVALDAACSHRYDGSQCKYDLNTGKDCLYA